MTVTLYDNGRVVANDKPLANGVISPPYINLTDFKAPVKKFIRMTPFYYIVSETMTVPVQAGSSVTCMNDGEPYQATAEADSELVIEKYRNRAVAMEDLTEADVKSPQGKILDMRLQTTGKAMADRSYHEVQMLSPNHWLEAGRNKIFFAQSDREFQVGDRLIKHGDIVNFGADGSFNGSYAPGVVANRMFVRKEPSGEYVVANPELALPKLSELIPNLLTRGR